MICSFNISKVWEFFSSLFFLQLEKSTNFGIYLRFCSVQGVENVVPFFLFLFYFYLWATCFSVFVHTLYFYTISKCSHSTYQMYPVNWTHKWSIQYLRPSTTFFWNPPLFFLCTYKCCLPVHIIHLMKDSQSQILVRSIQSVRVPYCRPIGV